MTGSKKKAKVTRASGAVKGAVSKEASGAKNASKQALSKKAVSKKSPTKRAAATESDAERDERIRAAATCDLRPPNIAPAIRQVMMPRDTNANGTIFGGVILAQIDLAAAIEAHRWHGGRLVTVAMNSIVFKEPVHVGDLVSFYTSTIKKGRTSVRVRVDVWSQRRFGSKAYIPVTAAEVTMVAIDEDGKPTPIESSEAAPLY
ncbi:putative acyl-CoA thioester hydrolase [Planctomycetes bacterium Pla163]|uniref:Putative acyl-CoA thioester hydrolase n=1 Tax=Rohdeia mirabilis TaxID=2528008 RepID=A0A518CVR3_9BACT|nr:putative acyl-CoA thioester hydrolase [Planctomycetes bacterium Pla163]